MSRGSLILFCFISSLSLMSQVDLKPVVSISNTNSFYVFHKFFNTDYIEQSFLGVDASLGLELSTKKSKINLFGSYQLSGSSTLNAFLEDLFIGQTFNYRSHFIGGGISYYFLKKDKRFLPYVSLIISGEVSTNSKLAFLNDSFGFREYPLLDTWDPMTNTKYWSYFYVSTPLIGSLTGGCVFRVNKNINIKLGAGYGLRKMKTKYAEWYEEENVYKKLETISTETHYFHMLDVHLGLTYSFSLKNKPKPQ